MNDCCAPKKEGLLDAEVQHTERSQASTFIVPGMGSNHCAGLIKTSLERLPGMINIQTNIAKYQLHFAENKQRQFV